MMSFLKRHLLGILALGILLAFGVQTYLGEHGLQARSALVVRIVGLDKKLQLLHEKKRELERMTKLMAPGAVDQDMLEYQARELLDFVYKGERVYVREIN